MSTIQEQQGPWSSVALAGQQLHPKYEKCRNITEEIYKRINITFQIKKLESGEQSELSDNSEQIDSNELSNETDLFACDKSDISSSEAEGKHAPPPPLPVLNNNNNNNEERKQAVTKRPRKRFRKRVKKRAPRPASASEGSSDEAPLARTLLILPTDLKQKPPEKYTKKPSRDLTLRELLKPDDIKVPTVIIEKITIDKQSNNSDSPVRNTESVRYSIKQSDKTTEEKSTIDKRCSITDNQTSGKNMEEVSVPNSKVRDSEIEKVENTDELKMVRNLKKDESADKEFSILDERRKFSKEVKVTDWKNCSVCNLSFRGERGLRRHMSMSHVESPEIGK